MLTDTGRVSNGFITPSMGTICLYGFLMLSSTGTRGKLIQTHPARAQKVEVLSCRCVIDNVYVSMTKQLVSCDCGNVIECIEEDEVTKPRYRSISGRLRLRCNDCGKEHEVFLKHKVAKFVGASPSFKEIE